jgi:molecular chaperone GrpE
MIMNSKKAKEPQYEPEDVTQPNSVPVQDEPVSQADTTPIMAELEALNAQLTEAQAQAAEYKDGWQRALADFQNYKRRTETEKAETYTSAVGNIIKRYLPVLDDLERALAARPANLAWVDGIELIFRKLQTILENEGLKRIEAVGKPFDPFFHEAIAQEPVAGVEPGTVIDVVQQGYMLGERVIRPASVRVAQ